MKPAPPPPAHPVPPRRHWRDALVTAGPLAVAMLLFALAAALYLGYRILDPTPVKRIVMATGPAQGAYAEFAKHYLPLLRANGVALELRPTQGAGENLALLRAPDSGVQVAFVQGGIDDTPSADTPALVSLGSVAYEPLWLFYREDSARRHLKGAAPTRLAQLAGWRIDTGPPGGGSGPLLRELAAASGLPAQDLHAGDPLAVNSVVDLVQGRVDALALVSAADAPLVQYLLNTPGVRLFDFVQAEAYARRFPSLRPLVLPRGVIDFATDQPTRDLHLMAATAQLVARADLHPALVQLLVQAAQQVHGAPGWFARRGEFPNPDTPGFTLAPEAERLYRSGPPWLQRVLPFWLANFIDRMWIVLLPLLAALLPLSRVLPPLVELRLRSRVFRWYAHLRAVEHELAQPGTDLTRLIAELDRVEAQIERIGVPLAYAHELYELRSHLQLVRARLLAQAVPGATAASGAT